MRSIFSKVLLWFVGTIALSVAGLLATSMLLSARLSEHVDFISKTQQLQLDGACQAYEEGGPDKLRNYLRRIDELYWAQHILVDEKGTNLVDGSDRSDLLARASWARWPAPPKNSRIVLSRASADGRYRLLILIPPPFGPWFFFPYFLWILLVVVVLGYVLAMHMARPLRGLRQAVERFGHGDLTTRFGSDRRDESASWQAPSTRWPDGSRPC
jgi:methyl-accepting chemotaxis protein